MAKPLGVSVVVFLILAVAPLVAAETVHLYVGGKAYDAELNGVPAKVCTGKSVQIISPRKPVDGDPDRPKSRGTPFPLERVKKGEQLGAVTLVTDGESFPFSIEMKGVSVSDAMIRGNGTWTMTVSWTSCSNVAKRK